eukprot:CAMPEP_0197022834 /NCGR_PEP_ID=MMETSP1384-20130603/3640_1 /TAXON_ID=29189 /ORGANISM="Ammonia sp." /LENGTH=60 /DNA_ID=CAMNT_0042450943 /DNA_START=475 /DNA_END=657 /DNA_ORIENTATION=+
MIQNVFNDIKPSPSHNGSSMKPSTSAAMSTAMANPKQQHTMQAAPFTSVLYDACMVAEIV